MAERTYEVYCGNYECPSRIAGQTHTVYDDELVDGQVWICRNCQPTAP